MTFVTFSPTTPYPSNYACERTLFAQRVTRVNLETHYLRLIGPILSE